MNRLHDLLRRIDGRSYPAYKDLRGNYQMEGHDLEVVHVQGDPFAAPSRIAVSFDAAALDLIELGVDDPWRRVGIEDALLRSFGEALAERGGQRRGSGKSGKLEVLRAGQEMLRRTACEVVDGRVVVRLTAGLPAQGRRVLGRQAYQMLTEDLAEAVEIGLFGADKARLARHADAFEDQEVLRERLADRKLVAFVADGAILPRASGVDDRPLERDAVPWSSPSALRVSFDLPNAGVVTGTGIKEGVTLICGGGYHGKSTLLTTIERSVYNHIPGDGRELTVTDRDAVHVRAEDGRAISRVDISTFIGTLPGGRETRAFSTENASGSTSQAANIIEAIELGASALLIDEDTSATNFMVRDRRMQALIKTSDEPITPFVDRVRALYDDLGISSILVVGGCGDYFDVADAVITLNHYRPRLDTERARTIAAELPTGRAAEERGPLSLPRMRTPLPEGLDPSSGRKRKRDRVRARRTDNITFGQQEIDISTLAQLVDPAQGRALADWLLRCSRDAWVNGERTMYELCGLVDELLDDGPLSSVCLDGYGDRAECRTIELAAALNRLRTLQIRS